MKFIDQQNRRAHRRSIRTIIRNTCLSIAVSGFALAHAVAARSEPLPVAVGVDPTFVSFFVAKQEKLFEKHGVDVTLVTFGPGGSMVDGMMAGQAVMTASTETTHILRMAKADIRILGIVGESGDNLKLVSSSSIDETSKIKTFGVVPGGVFEYLTNISMKKYNLDPTKVKIVKSGPPELPALLARGDIDAFWIFEPFPTMVVQQQKGRILARSKDVGYSYAFWISAMADWLKGNSSTARKIVSALAEACELTNANPELAASAVQAQVKIPAAQTLTFLKEAQCKVRGFSEADLAGYDAIADFLARANITKDRVAVRDKLLIDFLKN